MKLTLIENFRAMFYTPFYAAAALGAYEAEGLEIEMKTSPASAQTLGALTSGAGQVSWGGPMRIMLALDRDPTAGAVAFCEVVGRDPFFLVGREPNPRFRLQDLIGRRVGIVTEVPTPWICLQQDLRGAGIDPAGLAPARDRTMSENAQALRAGEVDVIQVFHPLARTLVDEGAGHLWYAAADRGPASYTTLNTTRAYIEQSPQTLLSMTRAIYRTQRWIAAHEAVELAERVAPYLPDVPPAVLAACCEDYRARGVWNRTPLVDRAGLEWKRDAMAACGAIARPLAFEDYFDTRFAEAVVREDPPPL
jgi:NitT/TauT family transport system substrate-binding protein